MGKKERDDEDGDRDGGDGRGEDGDGRGGDGSGEQERQERQDRKEWQERQPHIFEEIVDAKHLRYMEHYKEQGRTLFWGIGIENESYLQWSIRWGVEAFRALKPKRERYSVDYYKSFTPAGLDGVLRDLKEQKGLTYPVWLNAHTFQKMDQAGQHHTHYNALGTKNPLFTESLHTCLMRECDVYREMYDSEVVYDGDTIEFITQDYHRATVDQAVEELKRIKGRWLGAVGPYLSKWSERWGLPLDIEPGKFTFTDNEGLVTFLTTAQQNLGICNTQTLHVNMTLPSFIQDGILVDKGRFMADHLAWVSWIQVVEPLIVAVYGTPDVFSIIDPRYSIGSQRATRSRYISLQTYDVSAPINGKLLLQARPEDPLHWYNRMMDGGSVYQGTAEIGYDVNVNKFKNHGIEVRFLDAFPEEYLKGLMDLFILLGAHAVTVGVSGYKKEEYHEIIRQCLQGGFTAHLSAIQVERIMRDMGLGSGSGSSSSSSSGSSSGSSKGNSPYNVLCEIKSELWRRYRNSEIVQHMSPEMEEPSIVQVNEEAFLRLYRGVYGKRPLIIRSEASVFEQRTPIVPADIITLLEEFTVYIESSPNRCFSDKEYQTAGAILVPAGSWQNMPHALVVGLKGLRKGEVPLASQTLFHFAHAFKGQEGWRETLAQLGGCRFVDYEFITDEEGRRTLSFCKQAGSVGTYLTLIAYYGWFDLLGVPFSEERMIRYIDAVLPHRSRPRILLAGYGSVGRSAKEVLDRFSLECTVKRRGDRITAEEILSYDIYLHAIRIVPDEPCEVFLRDADLDRSGRRLTLIADMSCDLGHPLNPLPIYEQYGTREAPIQRLRKAHFSPPLDLIAIPYLPSFNPIPSSVEFSSQLVWYLSEWKWMRHQPGRNTITRGMEKTLRVFDERRGEGEKGRGEKGGGEK